MLNIVTKYNINEYLNVARGNRLELKLIKFKVFIDFLGYLVIIYY